MDVNNFEYMKIVNNELRMFDRIEVLEHPRFIMQYKLKKVDEYIENYRKVLNQYSN